MFYSSGPKRTHCRQVQWFYCCWCQLTAGKAEAGLAATDVLAAWWWLEEAACWCGSGSENDCGVSNCW